MYLIKFLLVTSFFQLSYMSYGINSSFINDIQKSIDTAQKQKKDTSYINTLLDKAEEYNFKNSDSLYALTKQAQEFSIETNYLLGQARSHYNLGLFYSGKGKQNEAIKHFELAYDYGDKNQNSSIMLDALVFLAFQYQIKGDFVNSLTHCLKGIELANKINNKKSLVIFNSNIATLYASLNLTDQASLYYKKSKELNLEINEENFLAKTICNIALLNIDQKDFEKAIEHINFSIKIFEKEKLRNWLAFAYDVKGRIFTAQEDHHTALLWFKKSEKIYSDLDDEHYETKMLIGMSQAYYGLKNDKKALYYADKALSISTRLEYLKGLRDSNKILYLLHKRAGNSNMALTYYENHQGYLNKLNLHENKKSVALVNAQNDYEKNKKQFKLDNEMLVAKQKAYTILSTVILLFLLTIIFFVRRNSRNYKSFNNTLIEQKASLITSEENLKATNKVKTHLLSIIGHDLKGPILSFQSLLNLYPEGNVDPIELASLLPRFKCSIDSIAFTLENLLYWSQTQINGFIANPKIIDLYTIINTNKTFHNEKAIAKSIKIENKIDSETHVYADDNQIEIVIRNLLSNALKFTPENGSIIIGSIDAFSHWKIFIKDNGVGIDSKIAEHILDNSYNYSTYGTNDEKGTGLGLSLCKQMIEINKGELWFESTLNKGTTFYFTLPKNEN